jgi:hypothetical protein
MAMFFTSDIGMAWVDNKSCLCRARLCWGSVIRGMLNDAEEGYKQESQKLTLSSPLSLILSSFQLNLLCHLEETF